MSEAIIKSIIVGGTIVGLVLCMSRCEVASVEAREKTKQEAMKQGYIQVEYDRWRKP